MVVTVASVVIVIFDADIIDVVVESFIIRLNTVVAAAAARFSSGVAATLVVLAAGGTTLLLRLRLIWRSLRRPFLHDGICCVE